MTEIVRRSDGEPLSNRPFGNIRQNISYGIIIAVVFLLACIVFFGFEGNVRGFSSVREFVWGFLFAVVAGVVGIVLIAARGKPQTLDFISKVFVDVANHHKQRSQSCGEANNHTESTSVEDADSVTMSVRFPLANSNDSSGTSSNGDFLSRYSSGAEHVHSDDDDDESSCESVEDGTTSGEEEVDEREQSPPPPIAIRRTVSSALLNDRRVLSHPSTSTSTAITSRSASAAAARVLVPVPVLLDQLPQPVPVPATSSAAQQVITGATATAAVATTVAPRPPIYSPPPASSSSCYHRSTRGSGGSNSRLSETELRTLIQDVSNDANLSQTEKNKRVQRIMSGDRVQQQQPEGREEREEEEPAAIVPFQHDNENLACEHYKKDCSRFRFSCCGFVDPCHRCHAERGLGCTTLPPNIESLCCNRCGLRQPPSNVCINASCGITFGKSHCGKCLIWTDIQDITHCEKCKLCRVGTPGSLFHCDTCEACINVSAQSQHWCARTSLKDNMCTVCLERTHASQKALEILRCGHVVHINCLRESVRKAGEYGMIPRCPTCRKCVFGPDRMGAIWESVRLSIELQPLTADMVEVRPGDTVMSPYGKFVISAILRLRQSSRHEQPISSSSSSSSLRMCSGRLIDWRLANGDCAKATIQMKHLKKDVRVMILCYDCELKSEASFHFLGLECPTCRGFNTVQL